MTEPVAWMLIDSETNARIPRSAKPKAYDEKRWSLVPLYEHPVEPIEHPEVDPAVFDKLREAFDKHSVTIETAMFEPQPAAPNEWLEEALEVADAYAEAARKYEQCRLDRHPNAPTPSAEEQEARQKLGESKDRLRAHLHRRVK